MDFAQFASQPDRRLDLLTGALLIAQDAHPILDFEYERTRIDRLALPVGFLGEKAPKEQARVLSTYLYDDCGFRGNDRDYYDPRNSYINEVLDRRLGIPISLALVYTEVARRAGVRARGVGFPGHFLVRIEDQRGLESPVFVDPFADGRQLRRPALKALLHRVTSSDEPLTESLLAPASTRLVLLRVLMNLRRIYASRGELSRLLVVLSRILELRPDDARQWRDRGFLAARLGAPRAAIEDLERYVRLAPDAGDVAEVRRLVTSLTESAPDPN